jgi:hypothetical protein
MSPAQTGTPAPSFMQLVKKTGKLAKTGRSRTVDPLTEAKSKILAALGVQEGYARLLNDGQPLPKNEEKTISTWFSKQDDGWWTSIRYGQISIPIDGDKTDMLIGDIKDVMNFYGAVKIAIGKGELDGPIGKLQAERSAALTKGKTGTQPAAPKAA